MLAIPVFNKLSSINLLIAANKPMLKAEHNTTGKVGIVLNKGTLNKEQPAVSFQSVTKN